MFIKYILFILLFKVLFFAKRSASDLKCIKANKWQNLTSSTQTPALQFHLVAAILT